MGIFAPFLPIQGSEHAERVDVLYDFIFYLDIFFFVLIVGGLIYIVLKYRDRGEEREVPQFSHHFALEVTWSVVPLILVIVIFFWGFNSYITSRVAPNDSMEVRVTAKKWQWEFEYPDGTRTLNELHVPIGRPVKLIMASVDVIHSFYLPTMREKMDVLPNRYTALTFTPKVEGEHQIYCTEYCGDGHSEMLAKLYVESEAAYKKWLETGGFDEKTPLNQIGAELYKKRACVTCHSIDGSRIQGPSFKGLYGKTEQIVGLGPVQVDDNYLRESIVNPNAKVVEGYPSGLMPTYKGLLKDREIDALIEYIKTLK
ncbi:MAG: cytochrome c oxidase subunit II [Acidobacteriota bacterium]|nr:cytochrome c oxidase subunit II [Blastocatellia bacterium]MDW8413016.1 cytochrome c oxidase subunit II [Acidobacteriota bacterium]